MKNEKEDLKKYISRIEQALKNTSKDYLKLRQNFESELENKISESESYISKLEKDLASKTKEISKSKSYTRKLEEINQSFERLKIMEQNRLKYYSSRL